MKTNYIYSAILIFAIGCLSFFANSSSLAKDETPTKKSDSQTIVYKPPRRGAPANRMGGGTRGVENDSLLKVLAPNHTGLTIHSQPILYWYIHSDALSKQIVFTLNDEDKKITLFQIDLGKIEKDGIQALNLADYQISLAPYKEYSWFVTMVIDPNKPSSDISSIGNIQRIASSAALSEKIAKADSKDVPVIYAEEGIWYDALSSISQLIELHPKTRYFHEQRAALLEQIGLSGITQSDRK